MPWDHPADTLRNNDVIITLKRRHFDAITTNDVALTFLLRYYNVMCSVDVIIAVTANTTLRPKQNDRHPGNGIFKCFSCRKSCRIILIIISLKIVTKGTVCNKSSLVQVMTWCCQATSHYLNQCWPTSPHRLLAGRVGHHQCRHITSLAAMIWYFNHCLTTTHFIISLCVLVIMLKMEHVEQWRNINSLLWHNMLVNIHRAVAAGLAARTAPVSKPMMTYWCFSNSHFIVPYLTIIPVNEINLTTLKIVPTVWWFGELFLKLMNTWSDPTQSFYAIWFVGDYRDRGTPLFFKYLPFNVAAYLS